MNGNLFKLELGRNRKNLIIWSSIVVAFTVLILAIFPSMKDSMIVFAKMEAIPDEMFKGLGVNPADFTHILGFYTTYYGIYIIGLAGVYAGSTGANLFSREERDRTAEFLYTKPMTRATVFSSKVAALYTLVVAIFVIQSIAATTGIIAFNGEEELPWDSYIPMQVHGFVMLLFFAALGMFISMFSTPKRNFMGMVVGIVFGSFLINAISQATESVEWMGKFTPHHYLPINYNATDPAVEWGAIAVFIVISIALVLGSKYVLLRKDLED